MTITKYNIHQPNIIGTAAESDAADVVAAGKGAGLTSSSLSSSLLLHAGVVPWL